MHDGFRDPGRVPAGDLGRFLEEADRIPAFRAVQAELRRALDLRSAARVLDAGCGIGLETVRLAAGHPHALVTGLDRNAELLAIARRRAELANVRWLESDVTALDLPDASFDAVRTERVLMYLADDELEHALDELARVIRPGGRIALFELDYGATILAPGIADAALLTRVHEALRSSLPQPLAGRRIPGLLAARGLRDVSVTPFSFAAGEPVWRRVVHDALLAGEPDPPVAAWLRERSAAAAHGEFVAAFTGLLAAARTSRRGRADRALRAAARSA